MFRPIADGGPCIDFKYNSQDDRDHMDSGHASLCYYIDHLTNSGCSEYIVGNLTIYF